jgi:hypothetical protein
LSFPHRLPPSPRKWIRFIRRVKNSAERRAILDALRGGDSVIYKVNSLKVHKGSAWLDTTPLDPKTKQATAEGGANLLHMENGKWRVMDISRVPEDPDDPMGAGGTQHRLYQKPEANF